MSIKYGSSNRPVVHIRAIVVEDHGDDLIVEFSAPRGSTQVQVGKSEIVTADKAQVMQ